VTDGKAPEHKTRTSERHPPRARAPRSDASEQDLSVPERLLRAAARLFASNGFDATTLQEVAAAAGLTKGAFYYYYDSKDQLLYEMHRRVISYQLNSAGKILSEEEDPGEALRKLVIDFVGSIARFRDEATIVVRESHRFPPEAMPRVQEDRQRLHDLFKRVIEAGQQRGVVRRSLSAELLTLALLGMCTSTYNWYSRFGAVAGDGADAEEIGAGMAAMCLDGMLDVDGAGVAPRGAAPVAVPAQAVSGAEVSTGREP